MTKLFYLIVVLFFFSTIGCKKKEACIYQNALEAADKYIYPVKPGTDAWNAAMLLSDSSVGQRHPLDPMYKICQVPTTQLQSMSTLGLIQSLEDNPCMTNILLRYNWFQGRNEVLPRLNVSWALNKRANAGISIMEYYISKDPNIIACMNTPFEKGGYSVKWYLFDMICTQDSIINQLDIVAKKRFAKIVLEKYHIKLKYPETYGLFTPTMLILSQLMIISDYRPYIAALQNDLDLSTFAETSLVFSDYRVIYNKIITLAQQFSKS
ncbi:MAG: hypothetical protein EAZ13_05235 [Sphingobacteriia bacterium]|nr:MAG: hypothetical protein EAZ41_05255 [Sphingobacteriia bacterium]TAG31920.1 MAG: hypothetical protein EAZ35_02395 [Sphingobacteriia bacterium]TAH07880.1 MAG: hypothetical protein EAZ13_05235 [Sphingobacteriia bacterium]